MVEDDIVLLAPAEAAEMVQIIVVKKPLPLRVRFCRAGCKPVLVPRKTPSVGSFGKLRKRGWMIFEVKLSRIGINVIRDPFVVFRAVNPGGNLPAFFYFRGERNKSFFRVGRVMQHADAKGVIESAFNGSLKMSAWTMCAFGKSRVAAKADSTAALKSIPTTSFAPHSAASRRVAAFAAAAFEHDFIFEKIPV